MLKFSVFFLGLTLPFLLSADEAERVELFDKQLNRFLNVRDFTMDEKETEAYFTIQSPGQEISQIAVMKKNGGQWSAPELLPFCNAFSYMEPFLTNDGKRLFFASDRPLADSATTKKDFDIWYVERNDINDSWSQPIRIEPPVNSPSDEFYPVLSKNNNLYFTADLPDGMGKDDIYFSRCTDNGYEAPVLLDSNINSAGYEFNAFISEQEDFIIFTKYNAPDGLGSGDLFISRKDEDGNWQKAVNVGSPINTKFMEYCPFYHPQSNTLYFTSRRNNLSPAYFKDIESFHEYTNGSENGLSKIYKVTFDPD